MFSFIVIVGKIPNADRKLILAQAKENGISVIFKKNAQELGNSITDIALGYISYLPCTPETIKDLFYNLPIGASEHFPLFQVINCKLYPKFLDDYPATAVFTTPLTSIFLRNIFNTILFHQKVSIQYKGIVDEVLKYRKQKYQLLKLSTALSRYNDLNTLLKMILSESCDIVRADAGSIYVRERLGPGKSFTDSLRFKVSLNYSKELLPMEEFTIKIDKDRIAGYVAYTGKILNIKDVYNLDDSVPYKYKKDFDARFNYRIKSMITVPLKNFRGDTVGILQLINKKKDIEKKLLSPDDVIHQVIDFSYSDEDFLNSIGALAAVSIERAQLHENIEQIFEGFLSSSIAAIDERDQVTSGHSRRVMGYAMAFVDAINNCPSGIFAQTQFSESEKRQFKFAALLHDIGKIGVPERILIKESRLSKGEYESLLYRFEIIRFQMLSGQFREELAWTSLDELESDKLFLKYINHSGFINDHDYQRLLALKEKYFINSYGEKVSLLTAEEWEALTIKRGNLTANERIIINSHANASFRILSKISWTPELEDIPKIASCHHEMLDGSGYPQGLKKEELPLESMILTVVDIFDAIVAQDRPYKPAMKPEKALEILRSEAQMGRLNTDVVEFFIEKEIYSIFLDQPELVVC